MNFKVEATNVNCETTSTHIFFIALHIYPNSKHCVNLRVLLEKTIAQWASPVIIKIENKKIYHY